MGHEPPWPIIVFRILFIWNGFGFNELRLKSTKTFHCFFSSRLHLFCYAYLAFSAVDWAFPNPIKRSRKFIGHSRLRIARPRQSIGRSLLWNGVGESLIWDNAILKEYVCAGFDGSWLNGKGRQGRGLWNAWGSPKPARPLPMSHEPPLAMSHET